MITWHTAQHNTVKLALPDPLEPMADSLARVGQRVRVLSRVGGGYYETHTVTLSALEGRYGCDTPYVVYAVADVMTLPPSASRQRAEADAAWSREMRAAEIASDRAEGAPAPKQPPAEAD